MSMSTSLPAQHFHPMQRTRTSASDSEARDPPRTSHTQNAWEDSTVASMFNDAASDRTHTRQASHGRFYEPPTAYQRQRQQQQAQQQPQSKPQQPENHPPHPAPLQLNRGEKRQQHKTRQQAEQHQQQQQNGRDENLPFVIDEGGILKVIPPITGIPPAAPPLNTISSNISNDGANSEDLYQDEPAPFDTPTKNGNGPRRARLPYRDNRGPYSPGSRSGYSPTRGDNLSMSPERAVEVGESLEQVRIEERRRRDRERQRERDREIERQREREEKERELQQKRSTVFADLEPIDFDEPSFNDTRAGILAPTSGVDPDDISSEPASILRTPRANRHLPPTGVLPLQIKELPLGRSNSRRVKEQLGGLPTTTQTKSLKRRISLDYNDAELHAMSFSDLKRQAFDYDPQAAALQQTAIPPTGGTIEERMEHYKDKGSIDQHQFFTRMTVDEWDEAGDWFLEQFSNVVQKIKKARKTKRTLMTQFEEEISAREEAVRGKIEGIGKTLEELKQEGQTMMEGKDTDLEF
ncbi:hypothetical protein QBC44DRAFT_321437 [Cladorrhinum sp. PSN332]|nr:hypothetical protein QBC44DRAFT_321437 [Cladorrhinum sp. PSN332]